MKIKNLLLFFLLICLACNNSKKDVQQQEKFDKNKWSAKHDKDYPYRDNMVNDIVYNDTVRNLNEVEILELLGEPDRRTSGYLYYLVKQKRIGAWPLHTKTLVIKFKQDGAIDWIKIHE